MSPKTLSLNDNDLTVPNSVLACSIFNVIQDRILAPNYYVVVLLQAIGNPSFLCVLGSRLLVNLREAGELGLNEGTNYRLSTRSVSGMEFADRNVEGQIFLTFYL